MPVSYSSDGLLGDGGYTCNYTLGEGLFLDLHDNLTEAQFRRGFQDLLTEVQGNIGGVYQVRLAFPDSQSVIDRWYGYREKPEAYWDDGSYLAYYTWEENGEWWHNTARDDKPCAHRISYNEERRRFRDQNRNFCQYTGEWDDNGDLLVTIGGTTHRAAEAHIDGPP